MSIHVKREKLSTHNSDTKEGVAEIPQNPEQE